MSDVETAAERLTNELKLAILRGDYAPGAKLPPERELAERLGVNRVTVRGALARLESMNLVAIRHGSGCVVRDYRRNGGLELLGALSEALRDHGASVELVTDLLDLRRSLAGIVLERLIGNISARDVAAISRAVDDFEALVTKDASVGDLARADLEVFRRIVEATGSVVLVLCMNPISEVVLGVPRLAGAMYAEPHQNVVSYRLLLAWLPLRKPEMLAPIKRALDAHDRSTIKTFKKSLKNSRHV